jgi:hypothetical protein
MEVAMTRVAAAPAPVETPVEALAETEAPTLVQRPDGWYWLADDGRQ